MKRLTTGLFVAVTLAAAFARGDAVVIFRDRAQPPQRITDDAVEKLSDKEDVAAVWVWSESTPPHRSELPVRRPKLTAGQRQVLHVSVDRGRLPKQARVTLIAAPRTMWEEVPEELLPSWLVTAGSAVEIPLHPATEWRVRVAGPRYGTWWVEIPVDTKQLTVTPAEAEDRRITVTTESARPIARARVSLLDEGAGRGEFTKYADYRSGEHGGIRIPALPDRGPVTILAGAVDRAPVATETRLTVDRMVKLTAGSTMQGRIVDPDHRPIAGVEVTLTTWVAERIPVPFIRSVRTSADGSWRIPALPKGRGELRVAADGYAAVTRATNVTEETLDFQDIVVAPGASVRINVRDERGEAVAQASISSGHAAYALTDAKGNAVLTVPPTDAFELTAAATGHIKKSDRISPPFPSVVKVVLARAFTITGRFVNRDGTPVNAATARVIHNNSVDNRDVQPNGSFSVDLEPDIDYGLELRSPSVNVTRVSIPPGVRGETRDLGDINPSPSLLVTGRVVDAAQSPVSGARVWLPRPTSAGDVMAWAMRDIVETASGADGSFSLSGLPFTPSVIRIDAPNLARAYVPINPQADKGNVDIGVVTMKRGTTLTVRLEGDVAEGAVARVDPEGHGLPSDTLSAAFEDGRAVVVDVPPGRAVVSAWRDRTVLCRAETDVPEASDREVLCNARKVAISGEVKVGRQPAGGGMVVFMPSRANDSPEGILNFGEGALRQQQVFSSSSRPQSAGVDSHGRFEIELLPGSWTVFWSPDQGRAVAPKEVSVATDAPSMSLALDYPGVSLTGTVLDKERRPVSGAQVQEMTGRGFAMTDDSGRFVLAGPDAGTWEIQAGFGSRKSQVKRVLLEESRDTDPVQLVLDAADDTIRVRLDNGTASAGALVFVESEPGGLRLVTADSDGLAELQVPPPAPSRIRAAANAQGRWRFGDWTSWDSATQKEIVLREMKTGGVRILTEELHGPVVITNDAGWRIDRLLQWLGVFSRVSPDSPADITGLPIGTYRVFVGSSNATATIEENKTRDCLIK